MLSIQNLLLLCLAISSTVALRTSLLKRDNYRQQVIREKNWPEFRKINEHSINKHLNLTIGQFGTSTQPLYDYADQMYFVEISVGTPPQKFEVLFDTATTDSWVIDNSCNGSYLDCPVFCKISEDFCRTACDDYCCNKTASFENLDPCQNKRHFNEQASTTYQKDGRSFLLPYGVGPVSGYLGNDTITLGDDKTAIKVNNVVFGQAQKLAVSYIKTPIEGVLGLGYQVGSIANIEPVFQRGLDQGLFDEPVFTTRLSIEGTSSRGSKGGDLIFGSRDPENCKDDAKFLPIAVKGFWSFNIDAVGVNGKKKSKQQAAMISYGTPLMLLSYSDLLDIVKASGAYYNFEFGLYQVDCNAKFSWSIYAGDNEFKVDSKYLVWNLDGNTCLLAASDWGKAEHPIDLVLAVPFLQQFCSIFDVKNGQVGFATKLNDS